MSRVAQWVRDRRRVRLGRFAAWLTVAVTLIVTSTTVWAQQSTSPGDASQVESVPADQAQLDPADVTGGITIREGLEATRPAVDDGTAGNETADILTGRPTVLAPRITDGPRLDGRLDDDVWRTASRLTDFVQQRPLDGAQPASRLRCTSPTTVATSTSGSMRTTPIRA